MHFMHFYCKVQPVFLALQPGYIQSDLSSATKCLGNAYVQFLAFIYVTLKYGLYLLCFAFFFYKMQPFKYCPILMYDLTLYNAYTTYYITTDVLSKVTSFTYLLNATIAVYLTYI